MGIVELARFLAGTAVLGAVFKPLRDPGFLARAPVVSGALTWPNGADVAPDAIRAHGAWLVE